MTDFVVLTAVTRFCTTYLISISMVLYIKCINYWYVQRVSQDYLGASRITRYDYLIA